MDFRDRVILVTGASRGIGAAIARAFAAEGAVVAVNYLSNRSAAEETVKACKVAGGDAFALQADVTFPDSATGLVESVVAEAGRIDALVNNAFRPYLFEPDKRKLFWETDWDDYSRQMEGAVSAAYHLSRAALSAMRARAEGAIINMASDLVARTVVPYHEYNTAKSALVGFTRSLAAELGPLGIRANCVAPGLVYPTEASRGTPEEVKDLIVAQTPLRRIATPEDVAGPVLFLASDWSRFMTGQTLYVDGGLVMG